MQSSFSNPSIPAESMVVNESSSSPKPTTLLLRANRPYLYNSWRLNNRLRLKNEKLFKRQKSSCCIAFYSLCICVSAGIMIIIIYRFTDECSSTTNSKQFFIKCLRHWLFLIAICTSLLACSGVIFGACRYFRSQRLNFLYDDDDEHVPALRNTNGLLPMTTISHCYCSPSLKGNGTFIIPSQQIQYHDDEHSSPRRKMPPFNYDESIPCIISISPNIDTRNKSRVCSSSTSTLSSPQLIYSSPRTSNTTTATISSNKSKVTRTPTSDSNYVSEVNDVWERQ